MSSADTHSLVTQIHTDFSESLKDIAAFDTAVTTANTAMGTLATNAKEAKAGLTGLDMSIGKKLKTAVDEIRHGAIEFNGADIKKSIEKSLSNAVAKRQISFSELDGKDMTFDVKMRRDTHSLIREKVNQYINTLTVNAVLPPSIGKGVTMQINADHMARIKHQFSQKIAEAIDKHVEFIPTGEDKITQIPLGNEQINKVLGKLREHINKVINDPQFVRLDTQEIQPIKFSSKELEAALTKVQQAIGNVDQHLGGFDTKALNSLPPVKEKLMEFKNYATSLITRVYAVLQGIDNLKVEDKEFGYQQLAVSIQKMQETMLNRASTVVTDITTHVRQLPFPSNDMATMISLLEGVQTQIQKYIFLSLGQANKEIEQALNIEAKEIDGVKFKAPSVRKLQEAVEKASQEALRNLDVGNMSMDTSKTVEMFKAWATDTVSKMDTAWVKELKPLQTHLLAGHQKVMDEFVSSIMSLTKIHVKPDGAPTDKIELKIDMADMRKSIEKQMRTVAETLIGNVDFTTAGKKSVEEGIQLPKKIAEQLNKTVRDMLVQQTARMAEQVTNRQGMDFSEAHLEKFDAALFKESTSMINNIVKQAQGITKSLADGVSGSGLKNFSGEEQAKIKAHFAAAGTNMVEDFSKQMDVALSAFTIATGTAEALKHKVASSLSEVLKTSKITFDDAEAPIILSGAMKIAQKHLQEAITTNMKAWEPNFEGFSFSIDWSDITNPIQRGLNTLLNQVGTEVAAKLRGIVTPNKQTVANNQRVMTDVPEPDAQISTKTLHKDTRKFLADKNDMTVKDWEKMIPAYKGTEGVGEIMAANVAVIMNKFHETIGKNAKSAIQLYADELGKVQTPSNTTAVNHLALKLSHFNDTLNKKIQDNIDEQFKALAAALKGLKMTPSSMSFSDIDMSQAMADFMRSNMKNASAHKKGNKTTEQGGATQKDSTTHTTGFSAQPTPGEQKSLGYDRIAPNLPALVRSMLPSTFFQSFDSTRSKSSGTFNPEDENDLYLRGTRVAYEATKNQFRNKLSPDMESQLHDYLDNRYRPETQRIAAMRPTGEDDVATKQRIREEKTKIAQELRMAVEMARKELAGEKRSDSTDSLKNRLQYFAKDQALNAEGIRTKFLHGVDNKDYAALDTMLKEMVGRSNRLAEKPVNSFEEMLDAEMAMKNLKQETKAVTALFNRLAKEDKFGHQIDKLSDKMQHLVGKADLPLTLFEQFQHKLSNVNSSQDLDEAKLFYKGMVDQQRLIDKQKRDGVREEESFTKQRTNLNSSRGFFADNAEYNAQNTWRSMSRKLNTGESESLYRELDNYRNQANAIKNAPIENIEDIQRLKAEMQQLNLVLKDVKSRYQSMLGDDTLNANIDKLRYKLLQLQNMGKLDASSLNGFGGMLNSITNNQDLDRARMRLKELSDMQADMIKRERDVNKKADMRTRMDMYGVMKTNSTSKLSDDFSHKLTGENYTALNADLAEYMRKVRALQNMPIGSPEQISLVQKGMQALNQELVRLTQNYRAIGKGEIFEVTREKLVRDVSRLQTKDVDGHLPVDKYTDLRDDIGELRNNDVEIARIKARIQALRDEYIERKKITDEAKKAELAEKRKGDKIAQSDSLKGTANLQNEILATILRTVPALSQYNMEQLKVNNATDTWSARMRDAEGNVRALSGSLDRATGDLFQHSEALTMVNRQAGNLKYGGRGTATGNQSIMDRYGENPNTAGNKQVNPNGDFTSSVVNTMRYITAGALIGGPSMAMYQAWDSAKTFDYDMERARQNFVIKGDIENEMIDVAVRRVQEENPGGNYDMNSPEVLAEQKSLQNLAYGKEARKMIQDIAISFKIPIESAAKAFHIGSRSADDPNEAISITKAVAKAVSIEDADPEATAGGLEAMMNQYKVSGYATNDIMNMMIMAAQLSPATLTDQLQMQQKSGAIFDDNLSGMTKREKLATSISLGSIFSSATAKSGNEGGTFFKAMIPRFTSGVGLRNLQKVSKQKGYEEMDPFNADGSQKNFVDIFSTFMEKTMQLTDKDKKDLWDKVIPGWHMGTTSAIGSFFNQLQTDLQGRVVSKQGAEADTNSDGQISIKEAIVGQINDIQNTDDTQIDALHKGMNTTWDRQIQGVKSQWAASFTNVTDELKGEFGDIASRLSVFLRAVGDNAEGIATAISLASKVALALGARYAFNKVGESVDKADKRHREAKFGTTDRYLGAEQRNLRLNRLALEGQLAARPDRDAARRGVLLARQAEINAQRPGVVARRDTARSDYLNGRANWVAQHGNVVPMHRDITRRGDEMHSLNRQINNSEVESARITQELAQLENQEREVTAETKRLQAALEANERAMQSVNNRVQMLEESYKDMGLDTSTLKTKVANLNNEFTSGVGDVGGYDRAIDQVGDNRSVTQLHRLREELDRINREFREGKINIDQYNRAIIQTERAHMTGAAGIAAGGVGGAASAQTGAGLANSIQGMSGLGAIGAAGVAGVAGRSIMNRVRDFKATRNMSSLFGRGTPLTNGAGNVLTTPGTDGNGANGVPLTHEDVLREQRNRATTANPTSGTTGNAGRFGAVGRGLGKVARMGRYLKGLPYLGGALVGFEAINQITDAVGASKMEPAEQEAEKAKNLQSMIKDMHSINDKGKLNPVRYINALDVTSKILLGGVNSMTGGNGVSFGDSKSLLGAFWKEDGGKELDDEIKTRFGDTDQKVLDTQAALLDLLMPQEENPNPDELDEMTKEDKAAEELEELNETVSKIETAMDRNMNNNQSQYTIDQSKLLLSGVAEDSQQMRTLFQDYIEKNIKFIDAAIAELEAAKNNIADKDSDEYKDLESKKLGLEADKAKSELELKQSKMSEYDEIMGKLASDLKATETEYGIQKDDAILSGADADSPVLKKIETDKVNKSNSLISGTKSELEDLIRENNLQGSDLQKIQEAILELEKDQKDNLVAIKESMERNKASFNLPSGVQPISYMDHMMSSNTANNVSAQAGDVTVNVTIGNMGGTAKDAQKLGDSLADAIKKANQQMAVSFNRQVQIGVGSAY